MQTSQQKWEICSDFEEFAPIYTGIEPSPKVHAAKPGQPILQLAARDRSGERTFYLADQKGDFSILGPSSGQAGIVNVLQAPIGEIQAHKSIIPADSRDRGLEPEVLAGSIKTLKKTSWIALDDCRELGPERL